MALMNKAGGSAAFGRWAAEHIKTRIGAQLATMMLGIVIFVVNYFNCLTVEVLETCDGTHKVSRAKLSYIIDSTAGTSVHNSTDKFMGGSSYIVCA